jgi:hypothetical protein
MSPPALLDYLWVAQVTVSENPEPLYSPGESVSPWFVPCNKGHGGPGRGPASRGPSAAVIAGGRLGREMPGEGGDGHEVGPGVEEIGDKRAPEVVWSERGHASPGAAVPNTCLIVSGVSVRTPEVPADKHPR